MTNGFVLHSVVLLVAVVSRGDALACWSCSSDHMSQQYCRDPFNFSMPFVYTMECPSYPPPGTPPGYVPFCVKTVIKPQLGRMVTRRYCMWGPRINPEPLLCSYPTDIRDSYMEQCHVCNNQNGCNGSTRQFPPQPLGTALTLLGWLVLRS